MVLLILTWYVHLHFGERDQAFVSAAHVFLFAEILSPIFLLMLIFFVLFRIAQIYELGNPRENKCFFIMSIVVLPMAFSWIWYLLNFMCFLQGLQLVCTVPPLGCRAPEDPDDGFPSSPLNLLLGLMPIVGPGGAWAAWIWSWQWAPYGLFVVLIRTALWPGQLLLYLLGYDQFVPSRWRELWFGMLVWWVVYRAQRSPLAREWAQRQERGLVSFIVLAAFILFPCYLIYLITSTAPTLLYCFVVAPWVQVVLVIRHLGQQPLALEPTEVAAFVLITWLFLSQWHRLKLERLAIAATYKRMEALLRRAVDRPFYARLQPGFGRVVPGTFEFHMARASIKMLTTHEEGLLSKQQEFIDYRRDALRRELERQGRLPKKFNIEVSRENVVADSCNALFGTSTYDVVVKDALHVKFKNEYGDDHGGVTRDWFDCLARAMTQGSEALFAPLEDGTLAPRPPKNGISDTQQVAMHRQLFAAGKFLAIAVLHPQPLPLSFNLVLCKHFLKMPVDMHDVRRLDEDLFRQRVRRVLEPGGLDFLEKVLGERLTFMSAGKEQRVNGEVLQIAPVELVPGGAQKEVDEDNKVNYVQLLVEDFLCGNFRKELSCLLRGFWEVLPAETLRKFGVTPRELALMISGVVDVDPHAWMQHATVAGPHNVLEWFWEVVWEFSPEERCKLLHFSTGSSRLPPGGLEGLDPNFKVTVSADSPDHLPQAHTCANWLKVPKYTSKEQLKNKLILAINTEGFGFA